MLQEGILLLPFAFGTCGVWYLGIECEYHMGGEAVGSVRTLDAVSDLMIHFYGK